MLDKHIQEESISLKRRKCLSIYHSQGDLSTIRPSKATECVFVFSLHHVIQWQYTFDLFFHSILLVYEHLLWFYNVLQGYQSNMVKSSNCLCHSNLIECKKQLWLEIVVYDFICVCSSKYLQNFQSQGKVDF